MRREGGRGGVASDEMRYEGVDALSGKVHDLDWITANTWCGL